MTLSRVAWIAWSVAPTAAFAQTMTVTGTCPGTIDVTVSGATPLGSVVLYTGTVGGSGTFGQGPCAGTMLDLGASEKRTRVFADAGGGETFSFFAEVDSCGAGLQLLDVASCTPTPADQLPACLAVDDDLDGQTACDGDCDDADPAIHPLRVEVCDDGIDDNCSGTDASCASIGGFNVHHGPMWSSDPRIVSCIEACASKFGGQPADYHCSVDPVVLNFNAFLSGWGDSTFCTVPQPEDYSVRDPSNPGYDCGGAGCSYSAYVRDHCGAGAFNYCWTR